GSCINQDGTTNGITAPSLKSQERLERSVYDTFQIDPSEIQLVEAHGTGTPLGDPIEFQALTRAFRHYTGRLNYCAIGSIKPNLGHTQVASGVTGLVKVLLALKHKQIPPSLHFKTSNPAIQLEQSPFYVNTSLKQWKSEPGVKRRAALSAFGASGTNAHVVIEEGPWLERQHSDRPGYLLVLSARSFQQLRQQISQLVAFCQREGPLDCGNMSYTLFVGRRHFKYRLACVARNQAELLQSLTAWLEKHEARGVFVGEPGEEESGEDPARKSYGDQCIQVCRSTQSPEEYRERLTALADLYVSGYRLAYEQLFADDQYTRISLPTYPLARERYWVPAATGRASDRERPVFPVLPADTSQGSLLPHTTDIPEVKTFEEVWRELAEPGTLSDAPGLVICFLTEPEHQRVFSLALQRLSPQTRVVFIAQHTNIEQQVADTYSLSRAEKKAYRRLLQGVRTIYGRPDAVLYLWPLEDSGCVQDYTCLLYLLQSLADADLRPNRLLWAGSFANSLERCYQESWQGFGLSLSAVLPGMQMAGLYEESSQPSSIDVWAQRLWTELCVSNVQNILYREGRRCIAHIQPTTLQPGESPLRVGGVYLITGGGGKLGLLLGEYLARKYQAKLILLGRSAPTVEKQARIRSLETWGSQVIFIQADVCDAVSLRVGLGQARDRFGTINGVIHIAGLLDDRSVLEKDSQQFQEILGPKIQGTLALDTLLAQEPLDFTCYFSSLSAILGDFGSCDYAIANRFLMAYGWYRNELQQRGLRHGKTTVIDWPVWREGGMLVDDEERAMRYLKASGQRFLESEEGLKLFERLLAQQRTQHVVLAGHPERLPRFSQGGQERTATPLPLSNTVSRWQPEMKGLTIQQCLEWDLKRMISELLQIDPGMLERMTNLADFGFDSLSLASFARVLTGHFAIEVTPTLFYGHSTLAKLADYYLSRHAEVLHNLYSEDTPRTRSDVAMQTSLRAAVSGEQSARISHAPVSYPTVQTGQPIAIIGISGRFPGARTIDELWAILAEGQDVIEESPAGRIRGRGGEADRWKGGWVPGVWEFDPAFFEISPREAEYMDPRQRLLLQESWRALEDAGYGAKRIATSSIGIFVGAEPGDFQLFFKEQSSITANSNAILASRLAYFLNLHGPVLSIDTACSSSLVALHQACQSIRSGECDTALAAGVCLLLARETLQTMKQAGMLSEDGRCAAFGEQASGMVPAEAVAVVVLKRLDQAIADGDPIYAVIKGSGLNYDGKTNGITAPSEIAQTQLLKNVYDHYRIDPEQISYIVTHGTGTRQGDPVEVAALQQAFQAYTTKKAFCALTSVKSNLGHTLAASGLVNLISLVQALQHETIPASIHAEKANTYIRWQDSPFFLNQAVRPWPHRHGQSRVGAVSSFGMSGTNSHAVVESYFPEQPS
ncbi:MAG TPA: SDR family NAD(P)-dependent oxidoreductase, partial [Ktedonobacteraceae bacterium]|nr:SDR family NAD(P)-dependent oxidoreductase [Ktedonobacteraceae bacterium]